MADLIAATCASPAMWYESYNYIYYKAKIDYTEIEEDL